MLYCFNDSPPADFVRPLRSSRQVLDGVIFPRLRAAVFTTILVWAQSASPQALPTVEYQVKAAFLLNFAKFIEWPADAFPEEKTPIAVCIFRHDPFGSSLGEMLRGKAINRRELQTRGITEILDLRTCQIIFVSNETDKLLPEILSSVRGTSALVVGETERFAERGGGVQFFLEENKLRFAINVDTVQKARVNVSSKLLALARIVHDPARAKVR